MTTVPACWALIPAAGIGARVGAPIPKQYLKLANKTILEHAVNALLQSQRISGIVFALNKQDQHFARLGLAAENKKIHTVTGGDTRARSVLNGLHFLQPRLLENDFVLVHDAARPCLRAHDLHNLIDQCRQDKVGGILVAPITDTVKQVEDKRIVNTLVRENIWRAVTPQMFRLALLCEALEKALRAGLNVTDEASAVEALGLSPRVVTADGGNIKVTTKADLAVAELSLKSND